MTSSGTLPGYKMPYGACVNSVNFEYPYLGRVNTRKGFTHGMIVGDIEGVEHGARYVRYRRSEMGRASKSAAS